MAKAATFEISAPLSSNRAEIIYNFLIQATAKQEKAEVSGTIIKVQREPSPQKQTRNN